MGALGPWVFSVGNFLEELVQRLHCLYKSNAASDRQCCNQDWVPYVGLYQWKSPERLIKKPPDSPHIRKMNIFFWTPTLVCLAPARLCESVWTAYPPYCFTPSLGERGVTDEVHKHLQLERRSTVVFIWILSQTEENMKGYMKVKKKPRKKKGRKWTFQIYLYCLN